ncbi:hypothetical protein [Phenylobacterium sp.]|nr:hypothetical protein [Phenylobacterium sp.]
MRLAQSQLVAADRKTTLTDTDPFARQPAGQVRLGDDFYETLAASARR